MATSKPHGQATILPVWIDAGVGATAVPSSCSPPRRSSSPQVRPFRRRARRVDGVDRAAPRWIRRPCVARLFRRPTPQSLSRQVCRRRLDAAEADVVEVRSPTLCPTYCLLVCIKGGCFDTGCTSGVSGTRSRHSGRSWPWWAGSPPMRAGSGSGRFRYGAGPASPASCPSSTAPVVGRPVRCRRGHGGCGHRGARGDRQGRRR